ncbi:Alpha/beta hydrolase domain-containing protein 14A [Oryzias melastigma]|uniref:Alpha/beta hydrolase domain-containing protein 14A n=1 Tax=Oryzias melastigma TaxID=30732 RepID=A0A834CFH5_ORYME|nr:Alpha/beta hydrolase domain-containing protein 14A [Oryzias melastigma]
MNFLRNRLVVLCLVLLATLLLYLLLPSIRQGSMEPSLKAQRSAVLATSPPVLTPINVSIRTGQLPGDPPLFFREALPVDGAGRQIIPRLQVVLLHGQAFTSKTWEELGTMAILANNGYQALAVDLPGYGQSPDSEAPKSEQNRVELLSKFMESLGIKAAVPREPVHERTLLDPFPHEEQRSAQSLRSCCSGWNSELLPTGIPEYSNSHSYRFRSFGHKSRSSVPQEPHAAPPSQRPKAGGSAARSATWINLENFIKD